MDLGKLWRPGFLHSAELVMVLLIGISLGF